VEFGFFDLASQKGVQKEGILLIGPKRIQLLPRGFFLPFFFGKAKGVGKQVGKDPSNKYLLKALSNSRELNCPLALFYHPLGWLCYDKRREMDWRKLKNNSQQWQIFRQRAKVIDEIRRFFKSEGFLEIQTPSLAPALLPESYLEVFATQLKDKLGKKWPAFLTPSPELWHKKLLVAGSGDIFEISKSFRNTDLGGHFHNPEFTLLEWYRARGDYQTTMKDCEELIRFLVKEKRLAYQGRSLRVDLPFARLSVVEAFARYAQIDQKTLFDLERLKETLKKRGYQLHEQDKWESVYNLVYLKEVEPNLGWERPTIIYDYPAQFAPLAKTSQRDSRFKERFELYLFGVELADGYSELNDPTEQKKQFIKEARQRRRQGKVDHPLDWDFVAALEEGLPDCSGVALGIERLLMVLLDKQDISEVLLFTAEEIFGR